MKKTQENILTEIVKAENSLGLYDVKALGIPLWRLLRFEIRSKKLNEEIGFVHRTTKIKLDFVSLLSNYIKSFFQLLVLIIKRKKYKHIVFAFPRLVKHNGVYFDKFTDPVIEQSILKENTLIVQRNLSGKQFTPRLKSASGFVLSDFVDYTSKILGFLCIPVFFMKYKKSIYNVEQKAKQYFILGGRFKYKTAFKIGEFYFMKCFIETLYSVIKCENIIMVDREIFLPHIAVAKKKEKKSFELQHGITHSETVLYSGKYQSEIDPDYFLTFGQKWIGQQFTIPLDKIYNIGWAYKTWINDKIEKNKLKNTVLVVSSPEITEKILKTVIELSNLYKDFTFILRLHPQEELSQKQIERITSFDNLSIDSKGVDSVVSVLKYEYCIGDNSSVLYEALGYGKRVAKITYNGLASKGVVDTKLKNIYYLKSKEDFSIFTSIKENNMKKQTGVYDMFNSTTLENNLK